MRIGRTMYGVLALIGCLGFGAALGVWLFALAGGHLFVVSRAVVLASLLVGLLDNFGKALFPELSYFTLFAPMAVILAIRPTGLFGRG